jgi:hypothetical protein
MPKNSPEGARRRTAAYRERQRAAGITEILIRTREEGRDLLKRAAAMILEGAPPREALRQLTGSNEPADWAAQMQEVEEQRDRAIQEAGRLAREVAELREELRREVDLRVAELGDGQRREADLLARLENVQQQLTAAQQQLAAVPTRPAIEPGPAITSHASRERWFSRRWRIGARR